ncbi:MAG: membrane protein insertase YidC, partial [Alphaproteobacteria bacterium]|nr:membrane protein insertase YidC [Alphaproteobacteria bacterium]
MLEQKNLLFTVVFSVAILLGYQILFEQPRIEKARQARQAQEAQTTEQLAQPGVPASPPSTLPGAPPAATQP